ncbi:hypothetical protein OAJ94_03375 [Deltaproteobacteria bacterium]|nr:hypothetical protein [Deltaproteobacteria bacterium]
MVNLFEIVGLGDVTGLDLLFASAALIGGILFIAWFFLLMMGGLAGGILDGVGLDVDMGADLSFKAFTFQGIIAFILMFGLVGLALSRSDQGDMMALFAGTVAGGASMWSMGKLFQAFHSVQSSGNMDIQNAIGQDATVYMRIKPGEVGQIQVTIQGAMRTLDAIASDSSLYMKTGATVTVDKIVAGRMVVIPYDKNKTEEE